MNALAQVFSRDDRSQVDDVTRLYISEILRGAVIKNYHTKSYQPLLEPRLADNPLNVDTTLDFTFELSAARKLGQVFTIISTTRYGSAIIGTIIVRMKKIDRSNELVFQTTLPASLITVVKVFRPDDDEKTIVLRLHVHAWQAVSNSELLNRESAYARLVQFSVARHFAQAAMSPNLILDDYPNLPAIYVQYMRRKRTP